MLRTAKCPIRESSRIVPIGPWPFAENDVTEYIREHARTYERHEHPLGRSRSGHPLAVPPGSADGVHPRARRCRRRLQRSACAVHGRIGRRPAPFASLGPTPSSTMPTSSPWTCPMAHPPSRARAQAAPWRWCTPSLVLTPRTRPEALGAAAQHHRLRKEDQGQGDPCHSDFRLACHRAFRR